MLQDIIFQENVLEDPGDHELAGPVDDGFLLPGRLSPGTVALIVGALLGGGLGQDAPGYRGRATGLWKKMGLFKLMAGRQNWR